MAIKFLSNLKIGNITYPTQDGAAGQVLATDGAGNLSFVNAATVDKYINGLSFSGGTLTASVAGGSNVSVSLDGRYALTSHNHAGVYDNYQSWNLKTNGVQRTTVQSGGTLDLVAGSNVSLSYSAGGVVTISSTDTNTNYYVTSASFNTTSGILTLTRNDGGTVGVDLDGKYSELGHTHDDRYYTETESDARFLRYYGVNAENDFQRFQDGVGEIRFDQINNYKNLSNAPGGYTYGGVLSMRGDNFGFQIWGSHTGDLYYKTQWSDDNYTGWRSIITSINIGSQSVNYASSAGSVAWTNVTGRPTALSQFTNDSGYITGSYIPAGGSWMADFASYGFTRQTGISYTGGEWSVLTNNAQISTLIDGSYFAGENGGFYSLNNANNYSSRKGFYNDGTYANFNTPIYVSGDIVNTSAIYPGFNNGASGAQTSYYFYGNTSNSGIRTNGNLLVNSDIYLGTRGQWLSTYLNQNVRTDSAPSFSSVYLGGSQMTGSMVSGLSNMLGVTTLPYSCDIVVGGDPDRFYAVQFWGGDQDVWRRIIIKRGYGEQAPWDPIGTGVHHGGLLLDWEGNFGGWGGAEYADRLRVFNESYTNVCADMFIYSHSMGYVFMLRGGGAVYHLFSDQPINGFYQSGSPDILYSTSTLSYDDTWSGTNQYDVPAPAPLNLSQVNSSRIDGLRLKKQSLLDGRYQLSSSAINTGNIGNQSVNYATTAGSVAWGNVSSKPGNLTYWDTWYGSAYLKSNGDLYMGWAGVWLSSWLNQDVRTDSAPTFRDVYTSGWFRNYGLHGLYNEDYGNFWYARSDAYWTLAGNNGSAVGIQLRTGGHEGSLRGYVYANSSNEIGFLNTSGSWSLRCDNSGNVTATADLIAYSDARLKENIETIDNALQKVVSLRGVSYNRIDTEDKSTKLGLVAQEVKAVLPEVVYEQEDGILGVSYGNIVGVLIEAMKEQQAMIETLEAKIELLTKFLK